MYIFQASENIIDKKKKKKKKKKTVVLICNCRCYAVWDGASIKQGRCLCVLFREQNPRYHSGTVNLFRERICVLISESEPEPEPEPLSYFGAGNGSVF